MNVSVIVLSLLMMCGPGLLRAEQQASSVDEPSPVLPLSTVLRVCSLLLGIGRADEHSTIWLLEAGVSPLMSRIEHC